MAVVEVTLPKVSAPGWYYEEGPLGFFSVPSGLVEDPAGSGLYIPSLDLVEEDGLYTIPGSLLGQPSNTTSNLHGFSVQEDATPIDPGSSEGGVGTISVSIDDSPSAKRYLGGIVLADGSRGKTSGIVRSIQATDGIVSLSADSILGLFNTEKTIMPFVGTLSQAVQYYCDLVGIPNDVQVHSSVASRSVTYPGGLGNVWVRVKQMLAAEQVEMALVFDRVYVRPLRTIKADLSRLSTAGYTLSNDGAAKSVEVNYYTTSSGTQMEVYPRKDEDAQIIVVDAGDVQVIEQPVNASLTSVNQPVPTYFVNDRPYPSTQGVYAVSGVDDLPIQPAQWTAAGGSLKVEITDDPSILRITVTGANLPDLSPFRIAMSSGSSNHYNSLHITGTGVSWVKDSVTIVTGASGATTSSDVGVVVDNPYIRTAAQAYSTGMKTAASYSGVQYNVSGTAFALNRTGDNRELIQMTIADFNAETVGDTFADFNAEWSGQTFADFNASWQNRADLLWENQLFGNAPGARVFEDEAAFRVTRATTNESSVQFTANLDTIFQDFNPVWAGSTIADFNAQFVGYTFKDFSVVPLRRG